MTIPASKILKASKSLVAAASLQHHSPTFENAQTQNVHVIVNNPTTTTTKSDNPNEPTTTNPTNESNNSNNIEDRDGIYVVYGKDDSDNPYKSAQHNVAERDLKSATANVEELSKLIIEKDNLIKALSLIIEMFQSNPLMINKYVIAHEETLKELIRLLTNADSVDIQLADLECSCTNPKTSTIKRIYLTVDDQIYSLDMCPSVLKLFETYRISLILVAL